MLNCLWIVGILYPLYVLSNAQSTLELVNLVYRHGDRSPVYIYPTARWQENNTPQWDIGLGWLTEIGMKQQYATGWFLRRRYDEYLGVRYLNKKLLVESSSSPRCLMSAYTNLAGMYEPLPVYRFNSTIVWQPIPVSMVPDSEDSMLSLDSNCPRYNKLLYEVKHSERMKELGRKNKAFLEFVSAHSGVKLNMSSVWLVGDTLICEKAHSLKWDAWVNNTIVEKIKSLSRLEFRNMFYTKEMARLKGGPLLKQFIENMNGKINGSEGPSMKMFMYSAHDLTLIALMSAIQLYNDIPPSYTATFIMELHKENGRYNVQMFYRNFTTLNITDFRPPIPLTLKGCNFKCPIETFLELTKDAIPTNWKEECKIPNDHGSHGPDDDGAVKLTTATIIAMCICLLVVGAVFATIVIVCIRRRNIKPFKHFH